MSTLEEGYLLLSSHLGDPKRKTLTTAQLRTIAGKAAYLPKEEGDLTVDHLIFAGIEKALAERTVRLLDDTLQLEAYIARARRIGCLPLTRACDAYPPMLRKRLGLDAPGCLWARGNLNILKMPAISLVGSRALGAENRKFAQSVGVQAANQGYALVSGNARGADSTAQDACLEAGGYVICVVADSLDKQIQDEHLLYLSEDDFDESFSIPRALHRNRVIHAFGAATFVAQCTHGKGGTWDGSVQNLHRQWTPLYCIRDGSSASAELEQMGAVLISREEIGSFSELLPRQASFFP